MADLAITSKVSVLFQCLMVLVVVIFSPVSESVHANGGIQQIASESIINTSTIFIGLGILSFAFVCQHSAFIVAGSLDHPTKERWGKATSRALSLCVVLEMACGVVGYLAFLENTEGDILNNFLDLPGADMKRAGNIARGLMCTTMFFVYPMDSFVCRHVLVVMFFRGRRAHEGDDASVLARKDRRVAITLVVYFSCLIPALVVDDVGSVLAITGTIGASCLAYIGPGLIYMAVYGKEFLEKVDEIWGSSAIENEEKEQPSRDAESSQLLLPSSIQTPATDTDSSHRLEQSQSTIEKLVKDTAWYLLLMPIWCSVASMGQKKLSEFQEKEALKSPHINRLGKCEPLPQLEMPNTNTHEQQAVGLAPSRSQPNLGPKMLPYGSMLSGGNKAIGAAILAQKKQSRDNLAKASAYQGDDVDTDIDVPPNWYDFCIAIFFIAFGVIALMAGLYSIIING